MRNAFLLTAAFSLPVLGGCSSPGATDELGSYSDNLEEDDWGADCRVFRVTATKQPTSSKLTLAEEGGSSLVLSYSVPGKDDPQLDNANWNDENGIPFFWARSLVRAATRESVAAGPLRASLCLKGASSGSPRVLAPPRLKSGLMDLSVYMLNKDVPTLTAGTVAIPDNDNNYYNVIGDSDGVVVQASEAGNRAVVRMLPYLAQTVFQQGIRDSPTCGAGRAFEKGNVPRTQLECGFYTIQMNRAPYGVENELLRKEMFETEDVVASPERTIRWSREIWDGQPSTLAAHQAKLRASIEANPGCTFDQLHDRVVCELEFAPVTIENAEQYVSFHPVKKLPYKSMDYPDGVADNGEVIAIRNADGTPAAAARLIIPSTDPVERGFGKNQPFYSSAARAWHLPAGSYVVVVKRVWRVNEPGDEQKVTLEVEAGRKPRTR